jgi:hypothetical protein
MCGCEVCWCSRCVEVLHCSLACQDGRRGPEKQTRAARGVVLSFCALCMNSRLKALKGASHRRRVPAPIWQADCTMGSDLCSSVRSVDGWQGAIATPLRRSVSRRDAHRATPAGDPSDAADLSADGMKQPFRMSSGTGVSCDHAQACVGDGTIRVRLRSIRVPER